MQEVSEKHRFMGRTTPCFLETMVDLFAIDNMITYIITYNGNEIFSSPITIKPLIIPSYQKL